jgi:hypothetical protein
LVWRLPGNIDGCMELRFHVESSSFKRIAIAERIHFCCSTNVIARPMRAGSPRCHHQAPVSSQRSVRSDSGIGRRPEGQVLDEISYRMNRLLILVSAFYRWQKKTVLRSAARCKASFERICQRV